MKSLFAKLSLCLYYNYMSIHTIAMYIHACIHVHVHTYYTCKCTCTCTVNCLCACSVCNRDTHFLAELSLVPSNMWGGQGLLGVSIRFCSFEKATENIWHVLVRCCYGNTSVEYLELWPMLLLIITFI